MCDTKKQRATYFSLIFNVEFRSVLSCPISRQICMTCKTQKMRTKHQLYCLNLSDFCVGFCTKSRWWRNLEQRIITRCRHAEWHASHNYARHTTRMGSQDPGVGLETSLEKMVLALRLVSKSTRKSNLTRDIKCCMPPPVQWQFRHTLLHCDLELWPLDPKT